MPTVVELKNTLRRYGLPVSGVKTVLTRRLVDARAVERTKRFRRAIITKNHPALRWGSPREGWEAAWGRLNEEAEAALRASGYEKHLKKNPTLQRNARRRLRRRQIASALLNEGRRRLVGQLPRFILRKEAGILKDYRAVVPIGHPLEADALAFLHAMSASVKTLLEEEIRGHSTKFMLVLTAELEKIRFTPAQIYDDDAEPEVLSTTAHFRSFTMPVLNPGDINEKLGEARAKVMSSLDEFTNEGSGWVLKRCIQLDLCLAEYRPFRGRSYFKTPKYIPARSVVNVQNMDNRCFEWAILSCIYSLVSIDKAGRVVHGKNAHRPSKYEAHLDELNFIGIEFPVKSTEIAKFECQNPTLSIWVFGWDKGPYPIYESKNTGEHCREVDLLLLTDPENAEKNHYVWIKDLGTMLFKNSKYNSRIFPCRRCLHIFSRQELLAAHIDDCRGISEKPQRTVMPAPNKDGTPGETILKFTAYHRQMRVPYIIYVDFECRHIPIQGCANNPTRSSTRKTAKQTPCSYYYIIVRCDGQVKHGQLYRGENAAAQLLESLKNELEEINEVFENPMPLQMSREDWRAFDDAWACHICGGPLERDDGVDDKVRDHCHITGEFRGAAHNICNLKLRIRPYVTKVPVVFHNLRGYDGHLIMQALGSIDWGTRTVRYKTEKGEDKEKEVENGKISCIPNNMEKYMTFSVDQLQFIDSLQFMNSSLEKLAANLTTENFKITGRGVTNTELELLRRKGVYPYEYVDSFERFSETQLPPKEAFYSHLSREHISDEDYDHAQRVWNEFGCKTFGDYHDLYLRTDVHLLADVFETFRDTSMSHYGLDPGHYFSAPGMSWDALLKKTEIELELLTDIDMHLFIEKGLRGGICMVSRRFAKANNPMCPDYDDTKPNTWIVYLDANNLYGWAMEQMLPVGGFQWVEGLTLDVVLATEDNAPEGYILEVDMEYPEHLHDAHNDYSLAPETMEIPEAWLSDYQRTLVYELGGKYTECKKLVPNLCNKEKYILHYSNLKLYHSLGMRVTKIHRAIKFRQEQWMAPYIQLNTELRKKATSDFEKDYFKLMNCSVFGKTMENLRKRIRVDLVRVSETDRMRRLVADPAYISHKIFDGDLVAIHSLKSKLKLNRPGYTGLTVLDGSKRLMYDFWYNKIKAQYGEKAQLCYTDTDSFIFHVETENIYEDMRARADLYDFSDYPKDHPNYSVENKKVPGKFKDECHGSPIAEFVGLRPKMYSMQAMGILKDNGWVSYSEECKSELRKAKGVQRVVVKKDLRHELYKEALFERKEFKHTQVAIRSHGHQIGVFEQVKTSLSPMDTKKWIAPDGITTRAYGHIDIQREQTAAMAAFINELFGE
jgi:hypothetical protein